MTNKMQLERGLALERGRIERLIKALRHVRADLVHTEETGEPIKVKARDMVIAIDAALTEDFELQERFGEE